MVANTNIRKFYYRLFSIAFLLLLTANPSAAQNMLKTEKIFLITLDGLRWQELFTGADSLLIHDSAYVSDPGALRENFWDDNPLERREKLLPFFWKVIAVEGQLYGNRAFGNNVDVTNDYWFSYPGYSEILCGFSDDERINSNAKMPNPNETVLEYLHRQPGFEGRVAAFASWDVFPFIINEGRSGVPVNAGFRISTGKSLTAKEQFLNELQPQIPSPWHTVRLDAFTHHYAFEYLKKHHPRCIYIAYGETDDFAHDGKYDAYLKSAQQTDAFIAQLWHWAQSQENYRDKTTMIITTDHGRGLGNDWRHHGKKINRSDEIWIAVIGPDSEALGEIKSPAQYYQNQIAKTAVAFLGFDYHNKQDVGEVVKTALYLEHND